jgi:hypothetical protein
LQVAGCRWNPAAELEGKLKNYLRRLMDRPAAQAARFFDNFQI